MQSQGSYIFNKDTIHNVKYTLVPLFYVLFFMFYCWIQYSFMQEK